MAERELLRKEVIEFLVGLPVLGWRERRFLLVPRIETRLAESSRIEVLLSLRFWPDAYICLRSM